MILLSFKKREWRNKVDLIFSCYTAAKKESKDTRRRRQKTNQGRWDVFVMISQDVLFSCHSDNPDNAIHLGRLRTPQVPLLLQQTLSFFHQSSRASVRPGEPTRVEPLHVPPLCSSSGWISVTQVHGFCSPLSQASATVANCKCHAFSYFSCVCVCLSVYVMPVQRGGKTHECSWKEVKLWVERTLSGNFQL